MGAFDSAFKRKEKESSSSSTQSPNLVTTSIPLPEALAPQSVRAARAADAPELDRLQRVCYEREPGLLEDPAVFESILGRCMSLAAASDGRIVGYVLMHDIRDPERPPRLGDAGAIDGRSPIDGESPQSTGGEGGPPHVFIHDLAVDPAHRRRGVGARLVRAALREAERVRAASLSLVSVQGSRAFWERFGFRTSPLPCPDALASYGPGAASMRRGADE